jgi:Tol biopolymer transport system component
MDLNSGVNIGPYAIERELGRGGMGIVYLATDARLGRKVALKALPEHFADDPDRLARFEREARTLAALSHPNVAGIYGVEEHDGRRYLILEFVEGESLADRLDRGPLPVDDALEICAQIAAGVEAAHEAGVIHRDLKPANIRITPDGKAKVLDFGLARSDEGASTGSSGSSVSQVPTMTTPLSPHTPTMPGAVLGTAPYMSPEQARGRKVDKRSDIWSLGVVLYECLTGSSPFAGETATDSIGAILHKDVEIDRLPENTPARIRDLLARMLQRDKSNRMRDAGDVWIELEAARHDRGADDPAIRAVTERRAWRPFAGAAAVVLVVAATYGATSALQRRPVAPISAAPGQAIARVAGIHQLTRFAGVESFPALTPDGNTLIYASTADGGSDIYAVRVGGLNPQNLTPNTPGAETHPVISPDGQQIAYASGGDRAGIWIMGATGESPRRLTDFGGNPAWSPDGSRLIFATEPVNDASARLTTSELWTVERSGGAPVKLYDGDAVQPAWSPNGRRIAFWSLTSGGQRDLFTIAADGTDRVALTNDGATDWSPRWSGDGRWLYFNSDRNGAMNLWRLPMNPETGRAVGDAAPVTVGVASAVTPALSAAGDRIVFAVEEQQTRLLRATLADDGLSLTGAPEPMLSMAITIGQIDLQPGGDIAATVLTTREDLAVIDRTGGRLRLLTADAPKDRGASWIDNGRSIVFYSDRSGAYQIWRINPDGSGLRQVSDFDIAGSATLYYPSRPPGVAEALYFFSTNGVYTSEPDDDGVHRQRTLAAESEEGWAPLMRSWSPDGTRLLGPVASGGQSGSDGVAVFSRLDNTWVRVFDRFGYAAWLSNEVIVIGAGSSLVRLDLRTGEERALYDLGGDATIIDIDIDPTTNEIIFVESRKIGDIWMLELDAGE